MQNDQTKKLIEDLFGEDAKEYLKGDLQVVEEFLFVKNQYKNEQF